MDDAELAAAIVDARRSGAAMDAAPTPTLERGYAVQAAVAAALGEPVGWKVGATSAGAQAFLKVVEPIRGRILKAGVVRSGDPLALPGDRVAEAEPEVLFLMGRDPGDGDPAAAVSAVHLGLEVNRPSRSDALELGAGFIVADNAAHAALVVGPEIPMSALDRPGEVAVTLLRNGVAVQRGDASAVLGHPLEALRWLARAVPLRAGDWVATGAITRSCPFAVGDEVVADFGALGAVRARRVIG